MHDGEEISAENTPRHQEELAEGDSLIPSFSKRNSVAPGTPINLDKELMENQDVKYVGMVTRIKEEVIYAPKLMMVLS